MAFDNLNYVIGLGNEVLGIFIYHLALIILVKNFGFHNTAAHSSHLGTILRVNNGCNYVSAESRTDLEKQILVRLTGFLVIEITNLKSCTVCCETAVKT